MRIFLLFLILPFVTQSFNGVGVNILANENNFISFNPQCSYVCTGTTKSNLAIWNNGSSTVNTRILIHHCMFLNIPTVVVTLDSPKDWTYPPSTTYSIYGTTHDHFDVYVNKACHNLWDIEWTAIGYIC